MQQIVSSQLSQPASPSMQRPDSISRASIYALMPPVTNTHPMLQRADDVNTILLILGEMQTSAVALTGSAGIGKSTLAALVYRKLQATEGTAAAPFRKCAWLTFGPQASMPDCLLALMSRINPGALPSDFLVLNPDRQIALLYNTLVRSQPGFFVVLDQFEELLDPDAIQSQPALQAITLFLQMLQQDLGSSRVIFTSVQSPYSTQNDDGLRVRSYMVSRVSMPEGSALLQQRGVLGSAPELSLVWQRCGGNVYALVLFSALFTLSGFSISYLLNSSDYQFVWNGDVTLNLISLVYNFLGPVQRTLLRALCLFDEPAPLEGILYAITGDGPAVDAPSYQRELAVLLRLSLIKQGADEQNQHDFQDDRHGHAERRHLSSPHYELLQCIRQYTREHYLEGRNRRTSGSQDSAIGVASEPNPIAINPEAREIGLAAGHMRVAAYYQRLASRQCPPRLDRKSLSDVEPLLEALRHLCQGWHWQQACDLFFTEGLDDSLVQWGAWDMFIRLCLAMVPPAGIVTRPDEAQICSLLGLLYGRMGDDERSNSYYQQALATQRQINDLHGQATTLINQGELLRTSGNTQQARANFERARLIIEQKPDESLQSVLLHNMGLQAQDEKDYPLALQNYLQSLKLAQGLDEPYNQGVILTNLGMLYFEQGRMTEALSLLRHALKVRRRAHDPAVITLQRFLDTLEQDLGPVTLARLQRQVPGKQGELLALH